jgi:hypothetical protein
VEHTCKLTSLPTLNLRYISSSLSPLTSPNNNPRRPKLLVTERERFSTSSSRTPLPHGPYPQTGQLWRKLLRTCLLSAPKQVRTTYLGPLELLGSLCCFHGLIHSAFHTWDGHGMCGRTPRTFSLKISLERLLMDGAKCTTTTCVHSLELAQVRNFVFYTLCIISLFIFIYFVI